VRHVASLLLPSFSNIAAQRSQPSYDWIEFALITMKDKQRRGAEDFVVWLDALLASAFPCLYIT
jgi:hypothetical protein